MAVDASANAANGHGAPPSTAPTETGHVDHFLDTFTVSDDGARLRVIGWAFVSEQPLFRRSVTLVLGSRSHAYRFQTRSVGREDVRDAFGTRWLLHTGFWVDVDLRTIPAAEYRVGLLLETLPFKESIQSAMIDVQPASAGPRSMRIVRSLAEVDIELREMAKAQQRSLAEWAAMGTQFRLAEDTSALPSDPLSPEYRESQYALYRQIAGVDEYNPWTTEPVPITVEDSVDPHPFPYSTREPEHVGNHLVSVGFILHALKAAEAPGRSLLEYGCGTGFTTIILAATGYDVTAVDINAQALQVVDRLAATRRLHVTTFNGEFGQVPDPSKRYDLVLFYESFHHCLAFPELVRRLRDLVVHGGAVVFAGEPIFPDFEKPWGLRLEGGALWEIRTKGWFELGFRESFFLELMAREGWTVTKKVHAPFPDIYIAKHTGSARR